MIVCGLDTKYQVLERIQFYGLLAINMNQAQHQRHICLHLLKSQLLIIQVISVSIQISQLQHPQTLLNMRLGLYLRGVMVLVSKLRPLHMQVQQVEQRHRLAAGLPQFRQLKQVVICGLRLFGLIRIIPAKQGIQSLKWEILVLQVLLEVTVTQVKSYLILSRPLDSKV
ncbi:hypothetical protein LKF24_1645 [Lactococcus lactis subsp. lactis]|nr:hypothetical protein LKF24_1645 [Lactococcus lactis subsp. lactis]